jgi:hypothetical protein
MRVLLRVDVPDSIVTATRSRLNNGMLRRIKSRARKITQREIKKAVEAELMARVTAYFESNDWHVNEGDDDA